LLPWPAARALWVGKRSPMPMPYRIAGTRKKEDLIIAGMSRIPRAKTGYGSLRKTSSPYRSISLPVVRRIIIATEYETEKKGPLEAPFPAAIRAMKLGTVDWQWANMRVEIKRKRNERFLKWGRYLKRVCWYSLRDEDGNVTAMDDANHARMIDPAAAI